MLKFKKIYLKSFYMGVDILMEKFVNLLSKLYNERYIRQIQMLVERKIPCGVFTNNDDVNLLLQIKNIGINIQCICVDEPAQIKSFQNENLPIVTLKEFSKLQSKPIFMLFLSGPEVYHYLFTKFGIETLMIGNVDWYEQYYNYIYNNLPALFSAYKLLKSEKSKDTFCHYLKGRLSNKFSNYEFAPEQQYWLEGFFPNKGDIVIDGGAYDGGTSVDFAIQGAMVYAFEMDANNYKNCLKRTEKYDNIILENMGLGSEENEIPYISGGAGSHKTESNTEKKGGG